MKKLTLAERIKAAAKTPLGEQSQREPYIKPVNRDKLLKNYIKLCRQDEELSSLLLSSIGDARALNKQEIDHYNCITSKSIDRGGQITSKSHDKGGQSTYRSIDKSGQITSKARNKVSHITSNSNEIGGQVTSKSTDEGALSISTSFEGGDQVTFKSIVKCDQITSNSIEQQPSTSEERQPNSNQANPLVANSTILTIPSTTTANPPAKTAYQARERSSSTVTDLPGKTASEELERNSPTFPNPQPSTSFPELDTGSSILTDPQPSTSFQIDGSLHKSDSTDSRRLSSSYESPDRVRSSPHSSSSGTPDRVRSSPHSSSGTPDSRRLSPHSHHSQYPLSSSSDNPGRSYLSSCSRTPDESKLSPQPPSNPEILDRNSKNLQETNDRQSSHSESPSLSSVTNQSLNNFIYDSESPSCFQVHRDTDKSNAGDKRQNFSDTQVCQCPDRSEEHPIQVHSQFDRSIASDKEQTFSNSEVGQSSDRRESIIQGHGDCLNQSDSERDRNIASDSTNTFKESHCFQSQDRRESITQNQSRDSPNQGDPKCDIMDNSHHAKRNPIDNPIRGFHKCDIMDNSTQGVPQSAGGNPNVRVNREKDSIHNMREISNRGNISEESNPVQEEDDTDDRQDDSVSGHVPRESMQVHQSVGSSGNVAIMSVKYNSKGRGHDASSTGIERRYRRDSSTVIGRAHRKDSTTGECKISGNYEGNNGQDVEGATVSEQGDSERLLDNCDQSDFIDDVVAFKQKQTLKCMDGDNLLDELKYDGGDDDVDDGGGFDDVGDDDGQGSCDGDDVDDGGGFDDDGNDDGQGSCDDCGGRILADDIIVDSNGSHNVNPSIYKQDILSGALLSESEKVSQETEVHTPGLNEDSTSSCSLVDDQSPHKMSHSSQIFSELNSSPICSSTPDVALGFQCSALDSGFLKGVENTSSRPSGHQTFADETSQPEVVCDHHVFSRTQPTGLSDNLVFSTTQSMGSCKTQITSETKTQILDDCMTGDGARRSADPESDSSFSVANHNCLESTRTSDVSSNAGRGLESIPYNYRQFERSDLEALSPTSCKFSSASPRASESPFVNIELPTNQPTDSMSSVSAQRKNISLDDSNSGVLSEQGVTSLPLLTGEDGEQANSSYQRTRTPTQAKLQPISNLEHDEQRLLESQIGPGHHNLRVTQSRKVPGHHEVTVKEPRIQEAAITESRIVPEIAPSTPTSRNSGKIDPETDERTVSDYRGEPGHQDRTVTESRKGPEKTPNTPISRHSGNDERTVIDYRREPGHQEKIVTESRGEQEKIPRTSTSRKPGEKDFGIDKRMVIDYRRGPGHQEGTIIESRKEPPSSPKKQETLLKLPSVVQKTRTPSRDDGTPTGRSPTSSLLPISPTPGLSTREPLTITARNQRIPTGKNQSDRTRVVVKDKLTDVKGYRENIRQSVFGQTRNRTLSKHLQKFGEKTNTNNSEKKKPTTKSETTTPIPEKRKLFKPSTCTILNDSFLTELPGFQPKHAPYGQFPKTLDWFLRPGEVEFDERFVFEEKKQSKSKAYRLIQRQRIARGTPAYDSVINKRRRKKMGREHRVRFREDIVF